MEQIEIIETGFYLPKEEITNEYLQNKLNLENNYIKKMTGIEKRFYAEEETIEQMAFKATKNLLKKNQNIKKEEIDLIIVATTTPNKYMPGIANYIQKKLDIPECNAFDILAGCNGYITAFDIASTYIQLGKARKALVIGAEILSKYTDDSDIGTSIILSDGAGAILLGTQKNHKEYFSKIISRGKNNEILTCSKDEKIFMNGKEIYKYAVTEPVKVINHILSDAKISLEDIKFIVPHQSNERIMSAIANRLDIPKEKMYMNIKNIGNTFCASIPIAINQMYEENLLHQGDKIILLGYGGGINTGCILLEI